MTATTDPNQQPALSPLVQVIAEAIAAKFTSSYGERNRNWDADAPDGPDNPYYLPVSMGERVTHSPFVTFIAGDGYRSTRHPSCTEIAEVVAAALTDPDTPTVEGYTRTAYAVAYLDDQTGQPASFVYNGDLDGCRNVLDHRLYDRSGPAPVIVSQQVTSVGVSARSQWTVVDHPHG